MKATGLWIYLYGLCGLLIGGCTPIETAPLSVTRPIAQTTVTDMPTATAAATHTPPPSSTTTPTPDPSLPPWTREPSATPTIQPTFTPIPGPVWPILFAGNPCPASAGSTYCNEQWPESGQWYQINSDGSNLRRVPQLDNPEPYDYDGLTIQQIRFSPDGDKIAYVAGNHIFVANLNNDEPLALVELPLNYWVLLGGFNFVPDSDCLLVYWRADPQTQTTETLSVEQVCANQLEAQLLAIIELPDLIGGNTSAYLSPQGDALLIMGLNNNNKRLLYAYTINSNFPPYLLFSPPGNENISLGPFRWQSDGQHIEFIFNNYREDDLLTITYIVTNREGHNLETRILTESTDNLYAAYNHNWSSDGHEVVFALNERPPEIAGIYISNLEENFVRQILPEFHISRGPFWSPEMP